MSTDTTTPGVYLVRLVARGTHDQGVVIGGLTHDQAMQWVAEHSTDHTAVIVSRLR